MNKFYITTPIYYPSAKLHMGHAYCTVAADTIARHKRLKGFEVMFLTGTDEHGQKIQKAALDNNTEPKAYVDNIVAHIKDLWKTLNISYDRFIRTTDEQHKLAVQKIFKILYDKGDIYKSEYEGLYCTPCESFFTEHQLKDGKCPDCLREVKKTKEISYFFRLSKYQERLIEYIESHPNFIVPETRQKEMINNFLKCGLQDLSISRTTFDWGIKVDFDPEHVIYVWLDALSNYITAMGYLSEDDKDFNKYWPCDLHLVGKEIVRFHTIIWPAILMALDIPLPKQVFGHGWLIFGGDKMSKSKGNVVDPEFLSKRYGVDAIRYFLLREIPFGFDGNFSNEALISRINADLANDLGNLVSRVAAMVNKYFGNSVKSTDKSSEFDAEFINLIDETPKSVEKHLEKLEFSLALSELWKLISRANKYIDETTPWILAKDEANHEKLSTVIYNLCECIRVVGILLRPFMPDTSEIIFKQYGIKDENIGFKKNSSFEITKGEVIFPRIDTKKELAELTLIN